MKPISAVVTSKGQVTIPKTVRDVLNIDTGSEVEFSVEGNGDVSFRKKQVDTQRQTALNLIQMFVSQNKVIGVVGIVGSGKTYLTSEIVKESHMKVLDLTGQETDILGYLRDQDIEFEFSPYRPSSNPMPELLIVDGISDCHKHLVSEARENIPVIITTQLKNDIHLSNSFQMRTSVIPDVIVFIDREVQEIKLVSQGEKGLNDTIIYKRELHSPQRERKVEGKY